MREVTVNDVLNQYAPIYIAKRIKIEKTPYIEFILEHMGAERLTVRELGEELMGIEKYHEKHRYYNGQEADFRTIEAREVTGVLTQALRKLCNMGVLERHEEKDMTKTIEIECDGYIYYDKNGNVLPEQVELALADGTKITIDTDSIKGVQRVYGTVKRKIHPKIAYYTFT